MVAMRRSILATILAALSVAASTPGASAQAGFDGPAAAASSDRVRADDGAEVIAATPVDVRTLDLTIESPALGRSGQVRLLLPPDWARQPDRRWPVFYLLHGCCDTYDSWTRETDIEALTSQTNVLVVMPEAGPVGFYSNWWNHGTGGPPAWETFHLTELRQILERGYRAGTHRAIAGLSMGGLGAMSYAARHPGMFRSAASYSGILNTTYNPAVIMGLLQAFGADPLALWGDPVQQAAIWAAHNPYDLARRLRGIPLYVSSGDGSPGPLDPPGTSADFIEQWIHPQNVAFAARAETLRLRLTTDLYGAGTHTWPYWQRALHRSFTMLMCSIGAEQTCPTTAAAPVR
jgi:diacylglycerol O-acyltransferase / trehalose O-mycolyltransferase / mycolyltransferase Ag85